MIPYGGGRVKRTTHGAGGLLFGGFAQAGSTPMADTWQLATAPWSWTNLSPAHHPSARGSAAMAYCPNLGKIVLFGGLTAATWPTIAPANVVADTWTFDGTDWAQVITPHTPPARASACMTTDLVGNVVLFGGTANKPAAFGDFWEFDGNDWTNHIGVIGPQPDKYGIAACWDPIRRQIVTFGGSNAGAGFYSETVVFDTTIQEWVAKSPAHVPPARNGAAMAFDGTTVVMFGGFNGGELGDTWTWDGTDWTQQTPVGPPHAGDTAPAAYDPHTNTAVLVTSAGGNPNLVWDFTPNTWTQESAGTLTTPRFGSGWAFIGAQQLFVDRHLAYVGGLAPVGLGPVV